MTRRWSRWLVGGAVLAAAAAAASVLAGGGALSVVLLVLIGVWVAVTAMVAAWKLWRWLTYRVGVRLLISYLLLGVTPFLFCAAFAAVALYMAMGQYTSVRFGEDLDLRLAVVRGRCENVLERSRVQGGTVAAESLDELGRSVAAGFPRVEWVARLGATDYGSPGAEGLPAIDWFDASAGTVIARHDGVVWAVVGAEDPAGGDRVLGLVALDDDAARAISQGSWYQVYLAALDSGEADEDVHVGATYGATGIQVDFETGGQGSDALWGAWPTEGGAPGLLERPLVIWFRMAEDVRDLATGGPLEGPTVLSLLRTSPARVWDDFVLSRYELSSSLRGVLVGMGVFFVVLYGIALLVAGTMIVFITRATARLSRGAREVGRGNLDYRIPVKRRDQLGDLASAFNRMADSVQDMLRRVADRERLARELELAREIQESLLPDRLLRHGPFTVHATFRPAAEVGGDYFDIFPLTEDRLVVVVGDVAGHGLHTGLLMASLKSSVAALVHEGYTGAELLTRVNRLVCERSAGHTMTTLVVVEIDPVGQRVRLSNAGHPPPFLITADGIEEMLAGSLPIGSPLFEPSQMERPFPPKSLLVLYSDGLPEATDRDGEPFGYTPLEELLRQTVGLAGGELAAAVLGALDRHVGDLELADDLTLLVVESGVGGRELETDDQGMSTVP